MDGIAVRAPLGGAVYCRRRPRPRVWYDRKWPILAASGSDDGSDPRQTPPSGEILLTSLPPPLIGEARLMKVQNLTPTSTLTVLLVRTSGEDQYFWLTPDADQYS